MTTVEIIDLLKRATTDLLWSSESDYPFEVVTWARATEMTANALFSNLNDPNLTAVDYSIEQIESLTLTDFFASVITVEDWYEDQELAQVNRYTALLSAIESNLSEVTVFRIGSVEIIIYIVGKTPTGDIIGLRTQVVET